MTEVLTPDICVIGAGSGGLSVAAAAAAFGVSVVLIEQAKMGGDCLNYGCVPSKALIAAAKAAQAKKDAQAKKVALAQQQDAAKAADEISSIINDEPSKGAKTGQGGTPSAGKPTGTAAKLSQSEMAALAAQMKQCWQLLPSGTIRRPVDMQSAIWPSTTRPPRRNWSHSRTPSFAIRAWDRGFWLPFPDGRPRRSGTWPSSRPDLPEPRRIGSLARARWTPSGSARHRARKRRAPSVCCSRATWGQAATDPRGSWCEEPPTPGYPKTRWIAGSS